MAEHMFAVGRGLESPEKLWKTAWRVMHCGRLVERDSDWVKRLCGSSKLCQCCAEVAAWKYGKQVAAKSLILLRRDPGLRFWHVTLTIPPGPDCGSLIDRIHQSFQKLRRRKSSQWLRLTAAVSQLHAVRARNRALWRPHLHLLVAATRDSGYDPKRLLLDWSECAYNLTPRSVSRRPDSGLLAAAGQQDQRLLGSMKGRGGDAPVGLPVFTKKFVGDVDRVVSYGGKRAKLSVADHLEVYRNVGRLRAPYGQFRAPNISAEELEATQQEVRELLEEQEKRHRAPREALDA